MLNDKISLAIFGNQNANSGFQPLFWINEPPRQLENIVPPGMDDNTVFFTLQAFDHCTEYTLIHNNVSSYMSLRKGVLKIAVAVPAGMRLAGGKSVMELLTSLCQTFRDTCMTRREEGSEYYNFNERMVSPSVFEDILAHFPLEPSGWQHNPMTGSDDALMLLGDDEISLLFTAPALPISLTTACQRIVVANKGAASAYRQLLAMPLLFAPQAAMQTAQSPYTASAQQTIVTSVNQNVKGTPRKHRWPLFAAIGAGTVTVAAAVATAMAFALGMERSGKPMAEDSGDKEPGVYELVCMHDQLLASESLTFEQTDSIARFAKSVDTATISDSLERSHTLTFIQKAESYDSLARQLKDGPFPGNNPRKVATEIEKIRSLAEEMHSRNIIEPCHYRDVRIIYQKPVDGTNDSIWNEYSANDANIRWLDFLTMRKDKRFGSFQDVYTLIGKDFFKD